MIKIRKATAEDENQIWEIFSKVIATGDTYVFPPDTPRKALNQYWLAAHMDTFIAEEDDKLLGTYMIKPNQIGLGNHIANCGYMVSPEAQGRGIGKELCEHSLRYAKTCDYYAIQFNIVVSTNTAAVALWKKYGFEIIGITPKGFRHSQLGLVDTYIMYKAL